MAVHLITGYAGKEHIMSKDTRSFNSAMFGTGEFVMEIGSQVEASIIDNNTVRIMDGDILMQGGHIRIETDTYEDMTIETGTAGKKRIDLIVMTYEKNATDGTEIAYLEVLKGTETEGTPIAPSQITGSLAEGALKNQMPLYRVRIEGVVLKSVEALFKTIPTYKKLAEQYAEQFENACNTYLGALNIIDSMGMIEANTERNQLAGALALKEGIGQIRDIIAYEWDREYNYVVGDYCIYDDVIYVDNTPYIEKRRLWKCKVDCSGVRPSIISEYWERVTVARELSKIGTVAIGIDRDSNPITGSTIWVTTSTGENKSIAQIKLGKGVWVITATCTFKANSAGYRLVAVGSVFNGEGSRLALAQPTQSATTTINGSIILEVAEESKTFYVTTRQTSGGDLDCMVQHFKAVRIA